MTMCVIFQCDCIQLSHDSSFMIGMVILILQDRSIPLHIWEICCVSNLYTCILFWSFRSSSKWRITLRRTTLASGWKCSNQSSLSQCHAGQHHHCHDFSDYRLCLVSALSFVAHNNCKTSSQNIGAVVNTCSSRDLTLPSISCMTPTCINLLDTTHSSNVINIVLLGDKDLVGNKLHVKSTNLRHSTYNHICIYYNISICICNIFNKWRIAFRDTFPKITIRCSFSALGLPTRKGGSLVTNNLVATYNRWLKYSTADQAANYHVQYVHVVRLLSMAMGFPAKKCLWGVSSTFQV